ncbi:DJ-1/PfpI family protein [Nocardioides sp.]|uniref:DJ-1/PfpI family protein n=1 Tax=Nocardioides sp. TaxID=35761 RepID=UPI002B7F5F82|nr:DJ-1/PfpI family protein [Nocardioides sp.]HXH81225.1 DJ-1/PfpI family protein [Nocardioides sp.]
MRLTILLFDGFTALDVVGGYEVLANVPGVEVEFVAATPGVVAADTRRLGLLAYRSLDEVSSTDILYVPGGPGVVATMADPAICSWIAQVHATATWTVGICNGVGLLAAAGVLDGGVSVTTNWGWRERIASYGVEVVPERFHRDGSVITGAGVSASIDAALFLAALIAGEDVARLVQLGIEYFPEPPDFARASLSEVSDEEKELLLAIEEGPMMERLSAATLPLEATAR